jgi:formylglycine-generating enzyme required for sulfatase activity
VIEIAPGVTMEFVEVPAGNFLMGSSDTDRDADDDEKPQHELYLPTYWIGKTPVTNAQFRPFVEGDGYSNQDYWTKDGWRWRAENTITKPARWNDTNWNGSTYPVVGISWFEAVAYCLWLADQTGIPFRLPTEAEWEKAARGQDGRIYPWGSNWEQGRCNSREANRGGIAPVGSYPDGASPYELVHMSGNVMEWCATMRGKQYPYQLENEWTNEYLAGDVTRLRRGGSWASEKNFVRSAYRRINNTAHYRGDCSIGMRLASSVL